MLKNDVFDLAMYFHEVVSLKDKANAKKLKDLEAKIEDLEARAQAQTPTPRG